MDFNRTLELVRKGVYQKSALKLFLGRYAESSVGPICCCYTKPLREIVDDEDDCLRLEHFGKDDCRPDAVVIGCSRGYMTEKEWKEDKTRFKMTLCKACADEAEAILARKRRKL